MSPNDQSIGAWERFMKPHQSSRVARELAVEQSLDAAIEVDEVIRGARTDAPTFAKLVLSLIGSPAQEFNAAKKELLADSRLTTLCYRAASSAGTPNGPAENLDRVLELLVSIGSKDFSSVSKDDLLRVRDFCIGLNQELVSEAYPPLTVRAKNIETLGGIDLNRIGLPNYSSEFRDRQPSLTLEYGFIVSAADQIGQQLAKVMYELARQIAEAKASKFLPDANAHDQILVMFEYGVPANSPRSMSDILNAGWTYIVQKRDTFDETERNLIDWVSELILKSVEVLEYRTRTDHA